VEGGIHFRIRGTRECFGILKLPGTEVVMFPHTRQKLLWDVED
jgi:hypothetical protein